MQALSRIPIGCFTKGISQPFMVFIWLVRVGGGGHLVMERQTVRRCQAALPPAVLQMSGLESHLAHRKHKQGLPSSPEFRGDEHRPCLMPPENQYRLSCLFLRQATKPARPSISISRILSTESGHPPAKGRDEVEGRNSSACDTAADSFPPRKLLL